MNNRFKTTQVSQDLKRLRILKAAFLKAKTQEQRFKIHHYLIKVFSQLKKLVSLKRLKPILGSALTGMLLLGFTSVEAQKFGEPIKIDHPELIGATVPDMADIDGDGDLDIVHAHFYSSFLNGYFENIGTSEEFTIGDDFTALAIIDTTDSDRVVTEMVDLDNDGDLDYTSMTYGDYYEQIFFYMENIGNGAFGEIQIDTLVDTEPLLYFAVDPNFVDIDGDGDLDLVTAGYDAVAYDASYAMQLGLMYVENIGTAESHIWGEASLEQNFPVIAQEEEAPTSIELADFDGDGDADIILSQYEDYDNSIYRVLYLENNGNGFSEPVELEFFDVQEGIALLTSGDVDGDGDVDIVFNNFPPSIYSGFPANLYWVENQNISNVTEEQLETKAFSLTRELVVDELQLVANATKTMIIEASVINSQGRLLKKESIHLQSGESDSYITLPGLTAGSYFLVVSTEEGTQTLSFTKM